MTQTMMGFFRLKELAASYFRTAAT